MKTIAILAAALCLGLAPEAGTAQTATEPDCAAIARQQTGFDPARPPPPAAVANQQVTGSGARVRGAAVGAVIGGASGGNAGSGAAAGAVAGGVAPRSRNRRAARARNEANAQQQQAGLAAYNQALAACQAARAK